MSLSLEHESLEFCFGVVNSQISKVIECSSSLTDKDINLTLDKIGICLKLVDSQGMFSKNEEIDDVQTGSLKVHSSRQHFVVYV
jgi:hypothetical protein